MHHALRHVADRLPTVDQIVFDATRGLCDPPPGVRLIPVTRGLFTAVDEADFDRFGCRKWCASPSTTTFYAFRRSGDERGVWLHREIIKPAPGMRVDHRNHNGLDNTRANLRSCTHSENVMNSCRRGRLFRGVSVDKGRFRARIAVGGREILVGYFDTAVQAALARDEAAKRLHGEFAYLNFPTEA